LSAITEAVIFFQDGEIVKEMYFTEFEAVLDEVVGIPDFADSEIQAVFLPITSQLKVTAAVFFLIRFDAQGRVTGHWNIPLRHLMDYATLGPDLGAGPIKVACHSACPEEWYQKQLWDPDMEEDKTFRQISAAAERNRLGILTEPSPEQAASHVTVFQPFAKVSSNRDQSSTDNTPQPVFHRRYRQKRRALLAQQRLALATQTREWRQRVEALENEHVEKLADRDDLVEQLQANWDSEQKQRKQAESQLQQLRRQLADKATELEQSLADSGQEYRSQLEALRQQYQGDSEQRVTDITAHYEELVKKREQELYARSTEIVELRAQLSTLREQNSGLMLSSDDHVLDEMVKKGIVFVAYHPGIEHLLIAKEEMPQYLGDPTAFAAARCEVSEAHYKTWLAHYRLPICRALEEGHYCGQPIDKVIRPRLFRSGESDRCQRHIHVPDE
jgi:hypothetical protein